MTAPAPRQDGEPEGYRKCRRRFYTTQQIDMADGEQLRITYGRRTMFVYANGGGLHYSHGGYRRGGTGSAQAGEKEKRDDS